MNQHIDEWREQAWLYFPFWEQNTNIPRESLDPPRQAAIMVP
ncbi:MAG TPA: hypothetical protein VI685_26620 [Candidatus Angelobacter sp.]